MGQMLYLPYIFHKLKISWKLLTAEDEMSLPWLFDIFPIFWFCMNTMRNFKICIYIFLQNNTFLAFNIHFSYGKIFKTSRDMTNLKNLLCINNNHTQYGPKCLFIEIINIF